MNAKQLKKLILSLTQDIEFEYNGKHGCICPFRKDNISMVYDDTSKDYTDVEYVMTDRVFNGLSLNDICENIEIW